MPVFMRARIADSLSVAAVLAVGAYVRLAHPDLTWFTYDQARDAYVASGIAAGRSLPLMGVEVGGGPSHTWGPLYFYLLAVPFALSPDPSVAVLALGVLTVASLWLTYRLGNAWFGAPTGVFAAALSTAYPRIVMVEGGLTNVAPVPLFTLLFFLCVFRLSAECRSVMIIPALAALAALVQFHLSTLALAVVLVLAIALFRPSVRPGHACAGLGLALALTAPYVVAQAGHGFHDLRAFLAQMAGQTGGRAPQELLGVARGVFWEFPDLMISSVSGVAGTWSGTLGRLASTVETSLIALGVAFACGAALVRSVRRHLRGPRQVAYVLLALWLVVPFLVIAQKAELAANHFELLYPAMFLAAAALSSTAIAWIDARAAPRVATCARLAICMAVAAIIVAQVQFQRQVWAAIETSGVMAWEPGGPISGPFELMPIRHRRDVTRALVDRLGVDRQAYFHHVHGSRFRDLLDDKGYFFGTTSPAPRTSGQAPRHYVLDRSNPPSNHVSPSAIAVGPYVLTPYTPLIDYAAWRCADDRVAPPGPQGAGWIAIRFPTAREPLGAVYGPTPLRSWRSLPVRCRGSMARADREDARIEVVVSLRMPAAHSHWVAEFRINEERLPAAHTADHAAIGAHTRDSHFHVGDRLHSDRNDIDLLIDGRGLDFDLDVYERAR